MRIQHYFTQFLLVNCLVVPLLSQPASGENHTIARPAAHPLDDDRGQVSGSGGQLFFSQFGDGAGFRSDIVLQNLSSTAEVAGQVRFYDPDGAPLEAGIIGGTTQSAVDFSILQPFGSVTISTDGTGEELKTGSAIVTSDGPLGGVIRFAIPGIGIAGVNSSPPLTEAVVPVRRQEGGINTGIALQNLSGINSILIGCSLFSNGIELGSTTIELGPKGQTARFINELFPMLDTSSFSGSQRCSVQDSGSLFFAAVALELGSQAGEFTTLPVIAYTEADERIAEVEKMLDHFKCYPTRNPLANIPKNPLELEDQFFTEEAQILRLDTFCNPVAKFADGKDAPVRRPDAHLAFYKILVMGSSPILKVKFSNQFRKNQEVNIFAPDLLGVPTQKLHGNQDKETPDDLSHFKCYIAVSEAGAGATVTLRDQFHKEPKLKVLDPLLFCNPVRKNETPIVNPDAHLVCYKIEDAKKFHDLPSLEASNQFDDDFFFDVADATLLCVPSVKKSFESVENN